ncbi:hypothetical protein LR48_Vigan11g102800 [Vigna angularis]|uniref:Uncharacterized protein n=1 Tax=Phaseolus angularis TaxID=3914 RepID=A0A0L9VSG5_PHAAN|nr:hypothetical protein LR48_Vigan11g102800 [Vigna angularis]
MSKRPCIQQVLQPWETNTSRNPAAGKESSSRTQLIQQLFTSTFTPQQQLGELHGPACIGEEEPTVEVVNKITRVGAKWRGPHPIFSRERSYYSEICARNKVE